MSKVTYVMISTVKSRHHPILKVVLSVAVFHTNFYSTLRQISQDGKNSFKGGH